MPTRLRETLFCPGFCRHLSVINVLGRNRANAARKRWKRWVNLIKRAGLPFVESASQQPSVPN